MYMEIRVLLVIFHHLRHVGEIQLRVNTVREEIHCHRYDVYVSCSLAVAEKRSLDTISACQKSQLCSCNACTSVVMRMQ